MLTPFNLPTKGRETMKVKLLKPVTFENTEIPAGEVIDLSELSGGALVKEGAAEAVEDQGDDGNGGTDATGAPTDGANQNGEANVDGGQDDARAALYKALDAKYKRDDLAAAAKELGVEFTFDAKKGDIINAVIDAEKADVMLA